MQLRQVDTESAVDNKKLLNKIYEGIYGFK